MGQDFRSVGFRINHAQNADVLAFLPEEIDRPHGICMRSFPADFGAATVMNIGRTVQADPNADIKLCKQPDPVVVDQCTIALYDVYAATGVEKVPLELDESPKTALSEQERFTAMPNELETPRLRASEVLGDGPVKQSQSLFGYEPAVIFSIRVDVVAVGTP